MSLESYLRHLSEDEALSAADKAAAGGLSALEKIYIRGVLSKRKKETASAVHAGIPVISIGNITAGGTGKTPCIAALSEMLLAKGRHPAILTRGYKGGLEKKGGIVSDGKKILVSQKEAGDEPYMLAMKLPAVPVIAGRDRTVSAAAAKALGADVLLLDDGFQYWKLHRDLDIVLVDATDPFGGGHVIPRGLLREPMDALSRAGLFILTKESQVAKEKADAIRETLASYAPEIPVIASDHTPDTLTPIESWPEKDTAETPKKVFLLSGIGNPAAFKKTAEEAGLTVLGETALPDHHAYGASDIEKASAAAAGCGADAVVVTEKDAVKIKAGALEGKSRIPIWVIGIRMKFSGDGEMISIPRVEDIL